MKIKFEYTFEDGCYGYVDFKDERTVEAELEGLTEIELPPCNKRVKVTTQDFKTAFLEFHDGHKLQAGLDKAPFTYSENYESFGDSRYYDLCGTVQLTEK